MAKIIVLSCKGGGGHMSAAQAIAEALPEHSVQIIDFLGETLCFIDPFFWLSHGRFNGQDCYNFLLARNYKRLINILYYLGHFLGWLKCTSIERAYQKLLQQHHPDLCISVIPLFNGTLSGVAKTTKIPLLVIPTDFDVRSFVRGLKRQESRYTWIAGALSDKKIRSFILPSMINRNRVCTIGFPVKKAFSKRYCKTTLLSELGIAQSKRVILLIMGATGSSALVDYCKALSKLKLDNIHILICIGRSDHLGAAIKKIKFGAGIHCSIVPSTISVAQAMRIADLCISKPGSVTFAETMYSKCVVFLDATSPLLIWEAFNIWFVRKYGNGKVITDYEQACRLVERFFNDDQWRTTMINNTRALDNNNFAKQLSGLVITILSNNNHSPQALLTQRSV